ncbi:MAG: hypothetical protein WBR35_07070 [Anaerolineae bacterium]
MLFYHWQTVLANRLFFVSNARRNCTFLPQRAQRVQIAIRPARRVCAGWAQGFAAMAAAGDDRLVDGPHLPAAGWNQKGVLATLTELFAP